MDDQKEDIKVMKRPCAICRDHVSCGPLPIRDDNAVQFKVTHIAYCPYCGRFLSENYPDLKI